MNLRKHFLEAATLILAAVLCAIVSNALASRERKLAPVGSYQNALKVPAPAPEAPPPQVPDVVAPPTSPAAVQPTAVQPAATTSSAAPTATRGPAAGVGGATTAGGKATAAAPPQPRNLATSQPTPTSPSPKPDLSKYAPHPDKQYIEIAYPDVAALHAGGALFLDARRTNIYEQGHIAGARSFSVWESDVGDKVRGLWEQRQDPKEQALPIVIYCSGGDCEDSHMLSEKLWGAQFSNLYVYKDGFPDWQAHRGAVHTGSNP